jgi:hypothetical protein
MVQDAVRSFSGRRFFVMIDSIVQSDGIGMGSPLPTFRQLPALAVTFSVDNLACAKDYAFKV